MSTWLKLLIFIAITTISSGTEDDKSKTLAKKMLARRREEHLAILKMIAQNPKYEHRFQLILIGITKSFDLMNEHKNQLNDSNTEIASKAKMIILENACLSMDFIVNFNKDIYLILNKIAKTDPDKNWRNMLQFLVEILESNEDLLDEITSKEFGFLKDIFELVMNEEQIPEYTFENSIRTLLEITEKLNREDDEKTKKKKKKLKKGPGLHGKVEL